MDRLGLDEDIPIEHSLISRSVESAQKKVEEQNFQIRKRVLEYDDVMNKQREVIYGQRQRILSGDDLREDVLEHHRAHPARAGGPVHRDLALLGGVGPGGAAHHAAQLLPHHARPSRAWATRRSSTPRRWPTWWSRTPSRSTRPRRSASGRRPCASWSDWVLLRTIDSKWRDHLYEMDYLREGIGLRALAQRDPLVEYKNEGFKHVPGDDGVHPGATSSATSTTWRSCEEEQPQRGAPRRQLAYSGGGDSSLAQNFAARPRPPATAVRAWPTARPRPTRPPRRPPARWWLRAAVSKVGRNDPCPCGSGKKYKKCCGA